MLIGDLTQRTTRASASRRRRRSRPPDQRAAAHRDFFDTVAGKPGRRHREPEGAAARRIAKDVGAIADGDSSCGCRPRPSGPSCRSGSPTPRSRATSRGSSRTASPRATRRWQLRNRVDDARRGRARRRRTRSTVPESTEAVNDATRIDPGPPAEDQRAAGDARPGRDAGRGQVTRSTRPSWRPTGRRRGRPAAARHRRARDAAGARGRLKKAALTMVVFGVLGVLLDWRRSSWRRCSTARSACPTTSRPSSGSTCWPSCPTSSPLTGGPDGPGDRASVARSARRRRPTSSAASPTAAWRSSTRAAPVHMTPPRVAGALRYFLARVQLHDAEGCRSGWR